MFSQRLYTRALHLSLAHLPHDHVKTEHIRCLGCPSVAVDLWCHPEVGPHLLTRYRHPVSERSTKASTRARPSTRYAHRPDSAVFVTTIYRYYSLQDHRAGANAEPNQTNTTRSSPICLDRTTAVSMVSMQAPTPPPPQARILKNEPTITIS